VRTARLELENSANARVYYRVRPEAEARSANQSPATAGLFTSEFGTKELFVTIIKSFWLYRIFNYIIDLPQAAYIERNCRDVFIFNALIRDINA